LFSYQLSVISYQFSLAFSVQFFDPMVFDDPILLLMCEKLTAAGLKIPVT
jgi:hypothetical protein